MANDMATYPRGNAAKSSPQERGTQSVKQALTDRMTLSEGIEAATNLMTQFPNAKGYSDGFIGALAQVLMQYPRQVVLKCIDVRSGLARDVKFLSISDVVAWLERGERPLHETAARDDRVRQQVKDTDAWRTMTVPESLKAKGWAWLDRTDPVAQEVSGQKPKIVTEEQRAALIESARQAGKELAGLRLRPETLATLDAMPPYCGPPAATAVAAASPQSDDEVIFGV